MADFLAEGFVIDDQCEFTPERSALLLRSGRNILRYDSAHDHRPLPHKHVYDTFGDGREIEIVDLVDESRVPTLGDVIRELQEWHQENAAMLR